MMPERIQLSRRKGWKMPPNTVRVDRATKWGNPYIVGMHGNAEQCVYLYRMLVTGRMGVSVNGNGAENFARQAVGNSLLELRDKNLACWCKPGQPCHADVLLELANKHYPER